MEKQCHLKKRRSMAACKAVRGKMARGSSLVILFLIAAVTSPLPARSEEELSDTVVVRGTTLKGSIVSIKGDGIQFNTQYGSGTIQIAFEDLEAIETQMPYLIVLDDDTEVRGRIIGIEFGHLLVGEDPATATRVPIQSLAAGISFDRYEKSFMQRLRHKYRYWKGSFDAGFEFEEGAIDKTNIRLGLNVSRRKTPTRFVLGFRYAFETEEKEEKRKNVRTTLKDEYQGYLTGEYDLSKRLFIYATPAGERDKPRLIKFRAYPHAGIGYRFFEIQRGFFQIQAGVAYVYEEFDGFNDDEYAAGAFVLEGRYELPFKVELSGSAGFFPSFSGPGDDWLYRAEIDFSVPLFDPLAMIFRITEVYDNNPAPTVGNNKLTTSIGLALKF